MSATELEEFFAIVRRDLGADDVRIVEDGELSGSEGSRVEGRSLHCSLPGGRALVLSFAEPPPDAEARLRRLEMLAMSFDSVLAPAKGAPASRQPPARSLREELAALALRAAAVDAVVIDARSPVVWGAAAIGELLVPDGETASANDTVAEGADSREIDAQELDGSGDPGSAGDPDTQGPEAPARHPVTDKVITAVRALPEMATLHKGGHLHHSVSEEGFGYVARSFAAIYVLVLAFREPFDELRAKRAIVHALPIIERLVLALPPLEPPPRMAGVIAMRRRRRR